MNEDTKELNYKLDNIKAMLVGNGKMGIAEMARRAFDMCTSCKKTKSGLLDWVFRIIIAVVLGFVAVKVGLK